MEGVDTSWSLCTPSTFSKKAPGVQQCLLLQVEALLLSLPGSKTFKGVFLTDKGTESKVQSYWYNLIFELPNVIAGYGIAFPLNSCTLGNPNLFWDHPGTAAAHLTSHHPQTAKLPEEQTDLMGAPKGCSDIDEQHRAGTQTLLSVPVLILKSWQHPFDASSIEASYLRIWLNKECCNFF